MNEKETMILLTQLAYMCALEDTTSCELEIDYPAGPRFI